MSTRIVATGICNRPGVAASEKTVFLGKLAHSIALHHPVKANRAAFPGVVKKMIENISCELPVASNLHYLSNSSRLQIVEVPAKNPIAVIAKNRFPEFGTGMHALHERKKTFQGTQIIFWQQRIPSAELAEAPEKCFGIKLRCVQRRLGVAEWTHPKPCAQAIHQGTKRLGGKP